MNFLLIHTALTLEIKIKKINLFSDYNWSLLAEGSGCTPNFCENGGVCLPQNSPEAAKCLCQPGFTGFNCATDMSSCAEDPCLNGANCSEDLSGGTAYKCHCEGTGHWGRHCEMVCQPSLKCSFLNENQAPRV